MHFIFLLYTFQELLQHLTSPLSTRRFFLFYAYHVKLNRGRRGCDGMLVKFMIRARCTTLSDRSVVFSGYCGFIHQ